MKTNKTVRRYAGTKLIDLVNSGTESVYAFIGKETIWGAPDTPPTVQSDNVQSENDIYREMLGIKKIAPSDVSYVIPRYNWTSGTVYDIYRDDYSTTTTSTSGATSLEAANFFVLNSANRVYKCISNNSGVPSTNEPTSTSTGLLQALDGYIWKYMYSISSPSMIKFASVNWIPIGSDSSVVSAAVDGQITHIIITNQGTGYRPSDTVPVFIESDGLKIIDTTVAVSVAAGSITAVGTITNPTTGTYTPGTALPALLRQVSNTGLSESATALIDVDNTGKITTVNLLTGGIGYISGSVTIEQSSAIAYATTDSLGRIINVYIPNAYNGSGITTASCQTISNQGSGFVGKVVISPRGGHGFDPLSELCASTVVLSSTLQYPSDFPDIPTDVTFRTHGIIISPKIYGSNTIFSANTGRYMWALTIASTTGTLAVGDTVYGSVSGAQARIVSKIGTTYGVTYLNGYKFISGEVCSKNGGNYGTISAVVTPEVQPFTGNIIHFDYIAPITRSTIQKESLIYYFNF